MGRSDRHQGPSAPKLGNKVEEDEDEEIEEDEAFNSDDERKYGSFFNKKKKSHSADNESKDDEEDSGSSSSDDEEVDDDEEDSENDGSGEDHDEDDDGGQYMLDLLDKLGQGSADKKDKSSDGDNNRKLAVHVKESEFSSSVLKPAGLTLESLMEGIQDTKGYGALARTMKQLAKGKVAASSLPRVHQDRLERKVHYESQSKKISAWTHVVQENRQAETLDFRPQHLLVVTKNNIIQKFEPKTDFEKQLHAALEEAGQKDERAILQAEEQALTDDLGANKITLEEFKARRGQLAKMRALMFYHEQKRHHINKIKSKKYRRIRKRQRERLKEAETKGHDGAAKELQEKEEVERIKERMTLAHKNTSKWAKRVLKRGKNVDLDTRRALSAQLKRGDDLRKKMNSTGSDDDDDDSDEDLVETARKVLEEAEGGGKEEEAVKGKGLFQLAFMQRGIQKERQRAKEEARQLLMELQANEDAEAPLSDDNEDECTKPVKKKLKAASPKEMASVLKEGEMVVSGLTFGNSTSLSVSGAIEVGGKTLATAPAAAKPEVSEHHATIYSATTDSSKQVHKEEHSAGNKRQQPMSSAGAIMAPTERESKEDTDNDDENSNPWMINSDDDTNQAKKSSKNKAKKQRVMVDVERAVDILDAGAPSKPKTVDFGNAANKADGTAEKGEKKALTSLTQEELVQRAFAVDQSHAENEFLQEKEAVRGEEDNPTRNSAALETKAQSAAGWGSWTGIGAPPPKINKNAKKGKYEDAAVLLKKDTSNDEGRLRQDAGRPHLIIRERRMKSLATHHMVHEIPYPFTSREEYELAMQGGIGAEWNVTGTVSQMTRPAIQTRAGKIIKPIVMTAKKRGLSRPAAKF